MPNLTAHRLLHAGQARADRMLRSIEANSNGRHWAEELGALRVTVRNLCAEVAAFEPIDGSVEVQWKGSPLWVHIEDELIQANGYDIAHLLSREDRAAIITLAEEVQFEQWRDDARRAREDAVDMAREAA